MVQQSFPVPRPTTNPYLIMLAESIAAVPGVELRTFSWRAALLGRYDVFHVHWPEILVYGQSPLKARVRQVLTVALMVRLALTRTPIVRTLHNLELPSDVSRLQRALLVRMERQTTLWLCLNDNTPQRADREYLTIPHGHYRDWFAKYRWPEAVPGRVSFFGMVRAYKGVDSLLKAFRGLAGEVSLRAAGQARSAELADGLTELARLDPRVQLDLHFLSDEEIVEVVREAELVVLPYREMHNSGSVLTTLSLDRPVLVPANTVNDRLASEVGPGWIHQYESPLTAADIRSALDAVAGHSAAATPPDLSRRDWAEAGRRHYEAYLRAGELLAAGRRARARGTR
ncbi:glycosyl transferase [Subtercola boreus]|uniref:Glycosyl transferase n=1 Tax=Subtercola boreus TaxID=120213 RepID=A0A3E0VF41_9MICO|nr:glycosyl transferase [Subtercola boreus]